MPALITIAVRSSRRVMLMVGGSVLQIPTPQTTIQYLPTRNDSTATFTHIHVRHRFVELLEQLGDCTHTI